MASGPNFNPGYYPAIEGPRQGLGEVADLLMAARAQEARDRAQAAKEARDKDRHEIEVGQLRNQESRAASVFATQEQERKRKEAQDKVKAQQQMNEFLRSRSPLYNPAGAATIGEAYGIGKPVQNLPAEPVAPEPPPELANNLGFLTRTPYAGSLRGGAPVEHSGSDEMARDALMADALMEGRARQSQAALSDPDWQGGPGRAFAQQLEEYQGRQEAYPGELARAQAEPTYYALGEAGRRTEFTPNANERALDLAAQEAAGRMREAAGMETDPYMREWYATTAALLEKRQLDPKKAVDELNVLLANKTKADVPHTSFEEKVYLARIAAAPKHAAVEVARHNSERADLQEPRKEAGAAEVGFGRYLSQQGYKMTQEEARNLQGITANIAKGGPALDTATAARYANIVQQRGILTDEDFARFWTRVGDIGTRSEDALSRALNGEMGEGKRQDVMVAITQLAENVQTKLGHIAAGADRYLDAYPEQEEARLMESYLPGHSYTRGAPQAPATSEPPWKKRQGGKKKGGNPVSGAGAKASGVDSMLKALRGK